MISKRTQFLKVGDPFSTVTDLGALSSRPHMEKVMSYLALAEVEGGTILCGGEPVDMKGAFENGYFCGRPWWKDWDQKPEPTKRKYSVR